MKLLTLIIATIFTLLGSSCYANLANNEYSLINASHEDVSLGSFSGLPYVKIDSIYYLVSDDNKISKIGFTSFIDRPSRDTVVVRDHDKVIFYNYKSDSLLYEGVYEEVKVLRNNLYAFKQNNRFGIFSLLDGMLTPFSYDDVFSLAAHVVYLKNGDSIDLLFNDGTITEFGFNEVFCGHGIQFMAGRKGKDTYYFVDVFDKNILLETVLDKPFEDGSILVDADNRLWCYTKEFSFVYDTTNSRFLTPKTEGHTSFTYNGNVIVSNAKETKLISPSGEVIISNNYTQLRCLEQAVFARTKKGYELLDLAGKPIYSGTFSDFKLISDRLFYGKIGSYKGVFNVYGEEIVPAKYEDVVYARDFILSKSNNNWSIHRDNIVESLNTDSIRLTGTNNHICLVRDSSNILYNYLSGKEVPIIGEVQKIEKSDWACALVDSSYYQFLNPTTGNTLKLSFKSKLKRNGLGYIYVRGNHILVMKNNLWGLFSLKENRFTIKPAYSSLRFVKGNILKYVQYDWSGKSITGYIDHKQNFVEAPIK